jgi:serine/threonine protein kinase
MLRKIPFLHPKVDFEDVNHKDLKLLSENDIDMIMGWHLPEGRYGKKELREWGLETNFGVIISGGHCYAVYKGKKEEKELGSGGYGTVKLVQDLDTGEWQTIKIMKIKGKEFSRNTASRNTAEVQEDLKKLIEKLIDMGTKEKSNLEKVDQLVTAYLRDKKDKANNETTQVEIIMTLASGVPLDRLIRNKQMTPVDLLDGGIEVFNAFQHLHQVHRLLHKDIKPQNILYDVVTRKATPIDFGFAADFPAVGYELLDEPKGSLGFIAPEIMSVAYQNYVSTEAVLHQCAYNEKTEVYALGVTLAEMVGLTVDTSYGYPVVLGGRENFKRNIGDPQARKQIEELIMSMLEESPETRMSLNKAIESLNKVRKDYYEGHLNILSRINNLGYLDVDDYLNASSKEKQEIRLALRSVDIVQLISASGKTSDYLLTKVKHELERDGIAVFNQVIESPADEPIKKVMDKYTLQLENKNNVVYHAYHIKSQHAIADAWILDLETKNNVISPPKKPEYRVKDIPVNRKLSHGKTKYYRDVMKKKVDLVEVDKKHIEMVVKSLQEQRDNLADRKLGDKRLEIMETAIKNLIRFQLDGNKINYKKLLDGLRGLENKLTQNRQKGLGKFMEQHFGLFRSTTTSVVHNAIKNIERDVGLRKKH